MSSEVERVSDEVGLNCLHCLGKARQGDFIYASKDKYCTREVSQGGNEGKTSAKMDLRASD